MLGPILVESAAEMRTTVLLLCCSVAAGWQGRHYLKCVVAAADASAGAGSTRRCPDEQAKRGSVVRFVVSPGGHNGTEAR